MEIQSCRVLIHDGRVGRDSSLVAEDGLGEVLSERDAEPRELLLLRDAPTVALPDGTTWPVIGTTEVIKDTGWTLHISIGSNLG
jgi:hypothetical protein